MGSRLGQHFLHDSGVLRAIVTALDLGPEDAVLEIGPGKGVLTRELAQRAGTVAAVELDRDLAARLREEFSSSPDVRIVQANALDLDPCGLEESLGPGFGTSYKLAGNIPYYITGALLRRYLGGTCKPRLAVLMVQLEVARRMLAQPGEMSLLSVSTQLFTRPTIVVRVPSRAFRPAPKVESAVVKLDVLSEPSVSIPGEEIFFRVARAGFATRRKQLINAISRGLDLPKTEAAAALTNAGIEPRRRAEELTLQEWSRLAWAVGEEG